MLFDMVSPKPDFYVGEESGSQIPKPILLPPIRYTLERKVISTNPAQQDPKNFAPEMRMKATALGSTFR